MKRPIIILAVAFFPWVCIAGIVTGYWMGRASRPQIAVVPTTPPDIAAFQDRVNEIATIQPITIDQPTIAPMPTDPPQPTATIEPTEPPTDLGDAPVAKGEAAQVGPLKWSILTADVIGDTLPSAALEAERKTSGRYVKLRIQFENTSNEPEYLPDANLIDSASRQFGVISGNYAWVESAESCTLDKIQPSFKAVCAYIYEIPSDAMNIMVLAKGGGLFEQEERHLQTGL